MQMNMTFIGMNSQILYSFFRNLLQKSAPISNALSGMISSSLKLIIIYCANIVESSVLIALTCLKFSLASADFFDS